MKKFTKKYNPIFKDFKLTELITLKDNGKKKSIGNNFSVHTLVNETLRPYGIHLWGAWKLQEGTEVRCTILDEDFPEENFPILHQMYSWINADIYICLERNESCEYGFYFNTETFKIRLVEYRWGEIKKDCFFNSFGEFWAERKNCKKKYERMLPKEDKL